MKAKEKRERENRLLKRSLELAKVRDYASPTQRKHIDKELAEIKSELKGETQ